jgi:hypothetical protein
VDLKLTGYGTMIVAGSLHSPGPLVPVARIRTQIRVPDANGPMVAFDFVLDGWFAHVDAPGLAGSSANVVWIS